eukprot:220377-Rhodomonas_salina.4
MICGPPNVFPSFPVHLARTTSRKADENGKSAAPMQADTGSSEVRSCVSGQQVGVTQPQTHYFLHFRCINGVILDQMVSFIALVPFRFIVLRILQYEVWDWQQCSEIASTISRNMKLSIRRTRGTQKFLIRHKKLLKNGTYAYNVTLSCDFVTLLPFSTEPVRTISLLEVVRNEKHEGHFLGKNKSQLYPGTGYCQLPTPGYILTKKLSIPNSSGERFWDPNSSV